MPTRTLKPGRALVITGPQGCGKTKLARQLAKAHGGYFDELDAISLSSGSLQKLTLELGTRVLIVDGLPSTLAAWQLTKQLITSAKVSYRPDYSPQLVDVAPPLLVFTTNDINAAHLATAESRYLELLDMTTEPTAA